VDDAARELSFHKKRIDDPSNIGDERVPPRLYGTRSNVYGDLRDVDAERGRLHLRLVLVVGRELAVPRDLG
jgi:hypothetical protein